MQISITEGPTRSIPLSAVGHGTTIVSDPPMIPKINLGPQFCRTPFRQVYTLTNSGRRHQSLVFSTDSPALLTKTKVLPKIQQQGGAKDAKFKVGNNHYFISYLIYII